MIKGATASYNAALTALRNNPAVLLDLNEDLFLETTPMEHLHLLLKFMSGAEGDANMISQVEEDPTLPMAQNQASDIFVPNFEGLSEMQNRLITPAHKEIISSMLPLQPEPHLNECSPKYDFLTPMIFRSSDYNAGYMWESTSDQDIRGIVKHEAKIKDESSDSTIFQNRDERSTRYFYSPTSDTIQAKSSVSKTYTGSIAYKRIPNTVEKCSPIAFQSTVRSLLSTKPREGSKVFNNQRLSSLDSVQLLCTRKLDAASKLYTCKTCKRNFKQRCHLYRHERKHSGVKRFFCIYCARGFYQRSNLSAHNRTHSIDSNISHRYACTFCTKRFTRKSSLMKHLPKHSNVLIKMK